MKSTVITKPVFQHANTSSSPQMVATTNAGVKSSNWATVSTSSYRNGHLAQEQKNINKQRKQRGTLVMKSHVQSQIMTPASNNVEWQQQQKQRLMVEQCRQQHLRLAQQYLSQNASGHMMPQYHRTNSVPIMRSQQQRVPMPGNVYQRE